MRWVVAAMLLVGCSGRVALSEGDRTYVGRLSGTDALVAVTVNQGHVRAYSCGGASTLATRTQWFRGDLSANRGTFTAGTLTLDLELAADRVVGFIEASGTKEPIDLRLAGPRGGLWSAPASHCATGLIALDDGTTQGAYCVDANVRAQVVPVRPLMEGDDAVEVLVGGDGPRATLLRVRATTP